MQLHDDLKHIPACSLWYMDTVGYARAWLHVRGGSNANDGGESCLRTNLTEV
jgi:hypothetical protein